MEGRVGLSKGSGWITEPFISNLNVFDENSDVMAALEALSWARSSNLGPGRKAFQGPLRLKIATSQTGCQMIQLD